MKNKHILFVSAMALVLTMGIFGLVSAYGKIGSASDVAKNTIKTSNSIANNESCGCNKTSKCANFKDENGDGKCDGASCAQNSGTGGCSEASKNITKNCGCGKK